MAKEAVLGERNSARLKHYDNTFSLDALSQARQIFTSPLRTADRSAVMGFTIDPEGAPDLDDAIWLEEINLEGDPHIANATWLEEKGKGGDNPRWRYLLHVSIADVASFIPIGSPLDQEALRRGFTRYSVNEVSTPMIPSMLSEDKLSLEEGEMRPTITFTVPIDGRFRTGGLAIRKSYIRNLRRFSYSEVADHLRNGDSYRLREYSMVGDGVMLARRIITDPENEEYKYYQSDRGELRYKTGSIVANFMIIANKELAKFFRKAGIPLIYRNYDPSSTRDGRPEDSRAHYDPYCLGHEGLDLSHYTHITSPLRRYADLVNQRIILAYLNGEHPPYDVNDLYQLCEQLHWSYEMSRNGNGKKHNSKP